MEVLSFDVAVVVLMVVMPSQVILTADEAVTLAGVLVLFRAMRAVAVGMKCRMGGGVKVPYGPGVARGCFWTCSALMTTASLLWYLVQMLVKLWC